MGRKGVKFLVFQYFISFQRAWGVGQGVEVRPWVRGCPERQYSGFETCKLGRMQRNYSHNQSITVQCWKYQVQKSKVILLINQQGRRNDKRARGANFRQRALLLISFLFSLLLGYLNLPCMYTSFFYVLNDQLVSLIPI